MTSDQHNIEKSSLNSVEEKSNCLAATLAIGSVVDEKYELIEILGRGAHGVVYKARHKILDQFVAIKFYDPQIFGSEHSTERFQKEASLLSTFTHPNIVKFQTFGKINDGQAYMVLEFLQGETLESIIAKNGPLDEARILSLFIQVCRGLKYVHEREVLHRDLKPSNIMIQSDPDGEHLKLMDFGVFKDLSTNGKQQLTQTGTLVGSANYMSPEQCKSEALSQSSDIYSIGCVMYEAFVGSAPMEAESELLIMSNQLSKEISEVRARRGISRQTEQVILRCLNKNPEHRFASAVDLEIALEQALQSPRTRRRSFAINPALLLVLLALAIPVAVLLFDGLSSLSSSKTKPEILANVKQQKRMAVIPEIEPDLLQSYQSMLDWLDDSIGAYYNRVKEGNKLSLHKNSLRGSETLNDPNDPKLVAEVLLRADILRERIGISTGTDENLELAEKYLLSKLHYETEDMRSEIPSQLQLQKFFAPHFLVRGDRKMVDNIFLSIKGNGAVTTNDKHTGLIQLAVGTEERRERICETYLLMSDVERWRGRFVEAQDYARLALEVPRIPDNLAAESLVRQGVISELLGDEAKSKSYLLRAASSDAWLHGTLKKNVAIDMLRLMNDLGMSQNVISCTYKRHTDAKLNWQEALIRKEIARAYAAEGKFPEAKKILEKALKACAADIPDNECSDFLELSYLRLLHTQNDFVTMKTETYKYLDALKSRDSKARYLKATAKVLSLVAELGMDTNADWQRIDQELADFEKEGKTPAECVELRLAEAAAARSRKDWATELDCCDKASHQIPEKTNRRMNCLRLVVNARKMEALSRAAEPDYTRIEEIHDSSHKHYEEAAAPFAFFNKDMFLRAILLAPITHSSLEKSRAMVSMEKRRAMIESKAMVEIKANDAGAIEDYADCAIHLANDYARKNQKDEAFSVLTTCLGVIQRFRPTRFDEAAAVCLSGSETAPSPALKKHCKESAAEAKAKAQLQDPDEIGWEPYRSWTRYIDGSR